MAVLQIIYLAINVIGIVVGLIYFASAAECTIFSNIFTFIHKYFKNIGVAIIAFLIILLMLPALAVVSAVISFTAIYGTYSDVEAKHD